MTDGHIKYLHIDSLKLWQVAQAISRDVSFYHLSGVMIDRSKNGEVIAAASNRFILLSAKIADESPKFEPFILFLEKKDVTKLKSSKSFWSSITINQENEKQQSAVLKINKQRGNVEEIVLKVDMSTPHVQWRRLMDRTLKRRKQVRKTSSVLLTHETIGVLAKVTKKSFVLLPTSETKDEEPFLFVVHDDENIIGLVQPANLKFAKVPNETIDENQFEWLRQ